jgi:hypothetical protein
MAYSRTRDSRGLNVPDYQYANTQNVKYETVIIPSTSQVAFGGYSIFDFKDKACLLNDIILQFQVTNLNAGPSEPEVSVPRMTSAFNWFTRIEIVQNNQIIDTIYPQSNFLQHQLFLIDEERKKLNDGAGDYLSPYKCYLKTKNQEYWYVPLWTYFKTGHIPCLYPKDDVQIRLYMDTLANNLVYETRATQWPNGVVTPLSATLTCNLVCNLTRLGQDLNLYRLQSLNKAPEQYKFLEMRYGTTTIPVNSNANPQFNYVLNSVTGNVVFLLAIVRPSNFTGPGGMVDPFQYLPVLNFSLLDSTSTNISGGQPVPLSLVQGYLSRQWTASSYYTDVKNTYIDTTINQSAYWAANLTSPNYFSSTGGRLYSTTSNCIMYSFSDDPIHAATLGAANNGHRFHGSEQLQLQFAGPITTGYNLDIYAYVESAVEITPTYVKKVSL